MVGVLSIIAVLVICLVYLKCYRRKAWTAPDVIFVMAFLPSSILLLKYIDIWKIDFCDTVLFVIVVCPFFFTIASDINLRADYGEVSKRFVVCRNSIHSRIEDISIVRLCICFFVECVAVLVVWYYVRSIVGADGLFGEIADDFRRIYIAESIHFPKIVSFAWMLATNIGYIWAYIVAYYFVCHRYNSTKIMIVMMNLVPCFVMGTILGARGMVVQNIFVFIVFLVFMCEHYRKPLIRVGKWFYLTGMMFFVVISSSFHLWGKMVGRVDSFDPLYYFAIYFSAPLVNLDLNIKNGMYNVCTNIEDCQTFSNIIDWIYLKFELGTIYREPIYVFNEINGYSLGNVPTAYANYLYDGGVLFAIFLVVVMAFLSALIYRKAIKALKENSAYIPFSILLYGLVGFYIFFSFFAEYFYRCLFGVGPIYNLLSIWLMKEALLLNIKINN